MSNGTNVVQGSPDINIAIGVPLLFLFYLIGDHLSRISVQVTFWFYLLVLLSCPLWFIQPLDGAFEYAKIVSIYIPIQLFNSIRVSFMITHSDENKKYNFFLRELDAYVLKPIRMNVQVIYLWFLLEIVLIVNIAEAVLADVTIQNYFNAAAGVILIVTLPLPARERSEDIPRNRRFMGIDNSKDGPRYFDFLFDLPLAWILLYTSWNMCFALDARDTSAGSIAAVLAAALVRSLWGGRFDLWMQSRVYTLALRYAILGYYDVYSELVNTVEWNIPQVVEVWGIINLVFCIIYAIWYLCEILGLTDKEPFMLPKPPRTKMEHGIIKPGEDI